jgi:hypothetical protein
MYATLIFGIFDQKLKIMCWRVTLSIPFVFIMAAFLCLNKNAKKSLYDSISFTKSSEGFTVLYQNDKGVDGEFRTKCPNTPHFDTSQELMEYLELTLDLLIADADDAPHDSIDLMMKGFPIVNLKLTERNKYLILKTFKFWLKF